MTMRFALALLLAALPVAAHAGTELALGIGNKIEDEPTVGVATLAWVTERKHPYEFMIGHIQERDDDIAPTTTFVAAGKRLTWKRWYAVSGIALADTPKQNRVLSGALQFMSGIGWSAERWSVSLRHLSNAGIEGRNHGETFLTVAYHL